MSVSAADAAWAHVRPFLEIMEANRRERLDHDGLLTRFPGLASVVVTDVELAGPRGPMPARIYRSSEGPRPTTGLVWVHGGGFVAGDLDMYETHWVALELAARGIAVVTLDYVKARPGVHHPLPSDDVLAGWLAVLSGDLLRVPPGAIHLAGASAGASLSVSIALRLRDGAGTSPASLLLVYPSLHGDPPEPSPEAAAAAALLPPDMRFTPELMHALNVNYVGSADALDDPLAFPATAELAGLPPTLIVNAEADDVRPSGETFGVLLDEAGVDAQTLVEPSTPHGYLDQPGLPAAVATIDRMAAWVIGRSPR